MSEYPSVKVWRGITPVGRLSFPQLFEPKAIPGAVVRDGEEEKRYYTANLIFDWRQIHEDRLWQNIYGALCHYGRQQLGDNYFGSDGKPTAAFKCRSIERAMEKPNIGLPDEIPREYALFFKCKTGVKVPPIVLNEDNSRHL